MAVRPRCRQRSRGDGVRGVTSSVAVSRGAARSPLLCRAGRWRRPQCLAGVGVRAAWLRLAESCAAAPCAAGWHRRRLPGVCLPVRCVWPMRLHTGRKPHVAKWLLQFSLLESCSSYLLYGKGQEKAGSLSAQPVFVGCLAEETGYVSVRWALCGFGGFFFFPPPSQCADVCWCLDEHSGFRDPQGLGPPQGTVPAPAGGPSMPASGRAPQQRPSSARLQLVPRPASDVRCGGTVRGQRWCPRGPHGPRRGESLEAGRACAAPRSRVCCNLLCAALQECSSCFGTVPSQSRREHENRHFCFLNLAPKACLVPPATRVVNHSLEVRVSHVSNVSLTGTWVSTCRRDSG